MNKLRISDGHVDPSGPLIALRQAQKGWERPSCGVAELGFGVRNRTSASACEAGRSHRLTSVSHYPVQIVLHVCRLHERNTLSSPWQARSLDPIYPIHTMLYA